ERSVAAVVELRLSFAAATDEKVRQACELETATDVLHQLPGQAGLVPDVDAGVVDVHENAGQRARDGVVDHELLANDLGDVGLPDRPSLPTLLTVTCAMHVRPQLDEDVAALLDEAEVGTHLPADAVLER